MVASETMAARVLLRVVARCRAQGHDAEALCRSAGTSLAALMAEDARVDYAVAARLGERALALTGDPDFGLELARDVSDTRNYDAGLLLMMASPSVRVAIERALDRQRYWGDGERLTRAHFPAGLALRYRLPLGEGSYARHADECALAELALGVRALSGLPLYPSAVSFRHTRPARLVVHHELFGCALTFGAPHTEIAFCDAVLDTPLPHANAAFAAIFAERVERAVSALPVAGSAREHVRSVARTALASGVCDLGRTARALRTSERTLQRRLLAEGTSFQAVIEALRRELSEEYRARGLALSEVAELLGYADVTAYHHARRRWMALAPLGDVARERDE